MLSLGLAFLLGMIVLFAALGGVVMGGVTAARHGRSPGASSAILVSLLGPLLASALLLAAILVPWSWTERSDFDQGAFDTFRTPLGGGFFATTIDSSQGTPFLDSNADDQQQGSIIGLACVGGVTVLDLRGGQPKFGVVRVRERRLDRFPTLTRALVEAGVPAGTSVRWLDRYDWQTTPCAPVPTRWQNTVPVLLFLGLSGTSMAVLMGAFRWRRQLLRSHAA